MSFQLIFWSALAVGVLFILPVVMICSVRDHLRTRGSDRVGSGGISSGVGAAMQELDRIMARPSVEHQVEAEHHSKSEESARGGD